MYTLSYVILAWAETQQVTLSRLIETCHYYLNTAPKSSEYAAILESGIELHCALVCTYPQCYIPEDKVLPTVASLVSFCKKLSSLSPTASFSELSTTTLLNSAQELLMRINHLQWNTVLGAIFEHLFSLTYEEESRATLFSLTLFLGNTTERFRKALVTSLSYVVHNLVQVLISKPEIGKDTLTIIADLVVRPVSYFILILDQGLIQLLRISIYQPMYLDFYCQSSSDFLFLM